MTKKLSQGSAKQRLKVDLWNKNMMHLVSVLTRRPSPSAKNFRKVSTMSPCLFAKSSKIDSHSAWNADLSLEDNVLLSLPLFYDFVRRSNQIDGFVYELPVMFTAETCVNLVKHETCSKVGAL